MTAPNATVLSEAHLDALEVGSGIAPAVIERRGYRTVERKQELKDLGFGHNQQKVPALLIPILGVLGDVVGYQARPDQPRIKDGRALKYETIAGMRMRLDVHPDVRRLLADPAAPLFITEGVKKGDALASRGACAVALLGVWNWRGTNDLGGRTALADWECVALNGRRVYIVFDSDVMLKQAVHNALVRLKSFLEGHGAEVAIVYLPGGPHAEKVGVDDYLAGGRSVGDLIALASTELRLGDRGGADDDAPYRATDQGIVWRKQTRDGLVDTPLTNFTARIVADIVEDDGAEERRSFEIEATLRQRTQRFRIPAAQFAGMTWATEHLGAAATCHPGIGTRDHARFAIQSRSGDVPTRRIYAHTGWRRTDAGWLFLHGGGAIGADGYLDGVATQLTGALSGFVLPEPPTGVERETAVQASLRLLDLGPPAVMAPLLGATYLAPLRELLGGDRPDFVPWLHGPTGAFKSEIAALAQSHFGRFSRQTLPASFTDTANAVERILFAAKDVLAVVDDYHPAHDRREEQTLATNASRLLRGVGNGAGRQRMRADTSLRPDLPPRALAMATGERLPSGHSTAARMFPVPLAKGDISSERLTAAQGEAHLYAPAMAAYVRWIAQRFGDLQEGLKARFAELCAAARSDGHPRDAAQVAHLQLGLETALQFAGETAAFDAHRLEQVRADAWSAMLSLSRAHQDDLHDESPVRIFLALLADGLASRRAVLDSMAGDAPQDAPTWGWLPRRYKDDRGHERTEYVRPLGGTFIGHVDSEWLYLIPEAAMQFVTSAALAGGQHFPVEQGTLLRRLEEADSIATQGSRRVVNQRILGSTRRVIKLKRSALSLLLQKREQREQREHGRAPDSSVPIECSRNTPAGGDDGNGLREQSASEAAPVPAVPAVPASGEMRDTEEREVMIL
ncbi:MAG: DUF3854 domain-containing protein [Chloroflexi bacterium]|nr:DUF3854 domain-containing protein [Chloroflexota bacterium]